jgi:hypothetical protein
MNFMKIKTRFWHIVPLSLFGAAIVLTSGCGVENGARSYDDIYADENEINEQDAQQERQEARNVYQDPRFSHKSNSYRQELDKGKMPPPEDNNNQMNDPQQRSFTR